MEDLNYKLAGLRDTVKKIKKEIKSFEENESKNIQNRASTLTNKIYRPLSYSKKASFNRLNKRLMKNYFKLSLKEQNYYNYKQPNNNIKNKIKIKNSLIDNNAFKEILTPQYLNKKINRPKMYSNNKNSNTINNNIDNSNNKNLDDKNYLIMTDINNNNINNKLDSCMNQNLFNFISARNKNFSLKQKEPNKLDHKSNQIEKVTMSYSNNDLKKNIYNDYFSKNKNRRKNKKKLLYNENNNYNKNKNHDLILNNTNNLNDQQSYFNENLINNTLIHNKNKRIYIPINDDEINKNNSYGKIKIHSNKIKNNKLKYNTKDFNYRTGTFRKNLINDKIDYGNKIFNLKDYSDKVYNMTQEYFNYKKKPQIFPMNNTINYISNNIDISSFLREEEFNKKKIKEIIENYSIGDLYIKAKLFEKCGENNFNIFVNNYCKGNNIINNLKNYKKFLIKVKEEENQYKKQINIYQKLCKRIMELMNPNQIIDIINYYKYLKATQS